jgi:hypothetical protein
LISSKNGPFPGLGLPRLKLGDNQAPATPRCIDPYQSSQSRRRRLKSIDGTATLDIEFSHPPAKPAPQEFSTNH